jgi:hypothetical protein
MYTPEKNIERKYVNYAKQLDCLALKFSPEGAAGYPDRVTFVQGGYAFFIEFKAKGKKPTALQEKRHAELRAMGFDVYVCDNLESAKELLNSKVNGD